MKEEEARKLERNQIVYYLRSNQYCTWGVDEVEIKKGKVAKVDNGYVYFQLEYLLELGLDNVEDGSYETMVEFERVFPTLEEAEAEKGRIMFIRGKKRSLDFALDAFFERLGNYIIERIDYHNDDYSAYGTPPQTEGLQRSLLDVLDLREELEEAQKEEK